MSLITATMQTADAFDPFLTKNSKNLDTSYNVDLKL